MSMSVHTIFDAIKQGDLSAVKRHVADGVDIGLRTPINETSLILAASYGYLGIVEYLVENGADINAQYDAGNTALIVASWEGHADVVAFLLSHGADIHITNKGGDPALAWAAEHGHLDIVKQLVDTGADIESGNPLTCACENDHLGVAKYLLARGADIETERACQDGFSPLVAASYKGYTTLPSFGFCSTTGQMSMLAEMLLSVGPVASSNWKLPQSLWRTEPTLMELVAKGGRSSRRPWRS